MVTPALRRQIRPSRSIRYPLSWWSQASFTESRSKRETPAPAGHPRSPWVCGWVGRAAHATPSTVTARRRRAGMSDLLTTAPALERAPARVEPANEDAEERDRSNHAEDEREQNEHHAR